MEHKSAKLQRQVKPNIKDILKPQAEKYLLIIDHFVPSEWSIRLDQASTGFIVSLESFVERCQKKKKKTSQKQTLFDHVGVVY